MRLDRQRLLRTRIKAAERLVPILNVDVETVVGETDRLD